MKVVNELLTIGGAFVGDGGPCWFDHRLHGLHLLVTGERSGSRSARNRRHVLRILHIFLRVVVVHVGEIAVFDHVIGQLVIDLLLLMLLMLLMLLLLLVVLQVDVVDVVVVVLADGDGEIAPDAGVRVFTESRTHRPGSVITRLDVNDRYRISASIIKK